MPRRLTFAAAITCTLAGATGATAEPPTVVASIKPVHALVAGVMHGVASPALLVPGAASPHTYGLKPSDARRLQAADLVFWISPGLETFLIRPLTAIPSTASTIPLAEAEGVVVHATREGGVWERHEHEDHAEDEHAEHADGDHDEHAEEEHAEHEHGETDMHLWLDPENGRAMVGAIAAALGEVDPDNAATYRANAERLAQDLQALDQDLQQRLEPVRDEPFIVFHDAYQYFERHYGLNGAGSITVSPERQPGARRLQEIRARLGEAGAVCVFSEPQFEPALIETVVEGTSARTGVLDPLGADLEPGPELYPRDRKSVV